MSDEAKKKRDKERVDKVASAIERMFEGFPKWQRLMLMKSHFLQSPEEKKARLKLVQDLSVELAEVKKTQRFILFGETAIEAVIEGDWEKVSDVMGWLTFSQEPLEAMNAQAPAWAKFRELLRVACVEANHREDLEVRHAQGQSERN